MRNNKFNYKTMGELKDDIRRLNLNCPLEKDIDVLGEEIKIVERVIPNRLAIHPMEGADANSDGRPGELTLRRYKRYAESGAGLIWVEAVAVNESGRANNKQLYLNEETVAEFKNMVDMIREKAIETMGDDFNPYLVIQLTHSGRFGENRDILFHHELADKAAGIDSSKAVMTDEELASLEDDFLRAARLAKKAGFDAVDVKACHRYLLSENLAAHTRDGKYGGDYENRTRLFKNAVRKISERVDIDLASRMNIYDAIPYPYGWGTDQKGNEDLSEPRRLVREMEELGVKLINVTAATPYIYPHINRPYDLPGNLGYKPPEHPLIGVERLLRLGRVVQEELNDCIVVGTGYTWLRQFAPHVAAGVIKNGWAKMIGFGRQAFAYPDFAKDIVKDGQMNTKKVCVTCSKCAELKAKKKHSGCVIRDKEVYLPIYQKLLEEYKAEKA
ncbi:NADH:flavin oxidoreductase [Iocasia frigidifontis]|uniref:NADH:flavin oxidoreductase n=1 Tax=Iocasia fonsfrigidae TaxID=2682810 RepID=A0A8A7KGQ3_9FIRM|nr:NADH:flavin oxidoreductase [Iocasia fonsfrigidae]QTL97334.1 NADH:flavin oxidoreductase [Iocasia fonsfrigidae]